MEKLEVNVNGEQKELIIREGEANPQYQYDGFSYFANSTDSFVRLVKAKASKENAVIAYTDTGMHAILDDTVKDRPQDKLEYRFTHSQQFKEWGAILSEKGVTLGQKDMLNFLKRREKEELDNLEELLLSVQNFRYVTAISGEAAYEDGSNYVFGIKVKDAEGTTKLPKLLHPCIQIFNESLYDAFVEVEVEVIKPRDAGEGIGFKLSCPKIDRYITAAVEFEVESMKKELDGYLIVAARLF